MLRAYRVRATNSLFNRWSLTDHQIKHGSHLWVANHVEGSSLEHKFGLWGTTRGRWTIMMCFLGFVWEALALCCRRENNEFNSSTLIYPNHTTLCSKWIIRLMEHGLCAIGYKLVYKVVIEWATKLQHSCISLMRCSCVRTMLQNTANVVIYFYQWQQEIEWR